MLNPKSASKSPLSSRVALPAALMLAGVFGLCISMIQPVQVVQSPPDLPILEPAKATPTLVSIGDAPAEAELSQVQASTGDLIEFCSKHVTDKRSFVIFKRGTCVVINEPCDDPIAEGLRILGRCKDPNSRFLTEPTIEGDMIVTFKEPVFHRFTTQEMAKIQPWLVKSAAALLSPEESTSAGEGWVPPDQARYGLLARRRMLEDAVDAVPVKVIRAKERAVASR